MLKNDIKIAFRNLRAHKFFSLLNIAGLALGMSACLTVILIIRDQLSYDLFHPDSERVFRINCRQADGMKLASVPAPLAATLVQDFSIAESGVALVRSIQNVDAATSGNLTLPLSGFYTGPDFFNIFGFQLESGNAATALSEPNTIVLSKTMAERFFGQTNPVGASLVLKNKGTYRVTGVVAQPKGKSHLKFDCLASIGSLAAMEQSYPPAEAAEKTIDNWENRYMSYVYVRLNPGKTETDLSNALAIVTAARQKAGKSDSEVHFFAQNLGNISPRPERLANDIGGGAPWFFIWGLGAFVLVLIVFPCLNYANLAVARALERTREVGVRKAIGARISDVKNLVLTESVLTSLLALAVACALHLPLLHFVKTYFPAAENFADLGAKGLDWIIFIVFGIAVGLLAGWLPARRMAKMQPSAALRGSTGEQGRPSRFGWRTMMLVGQFAVSLVILIFVTTLWSQMQYMTLSDYGFQQENMLTVRLQGNKADIVAAEMRQDPHVAGVCASSVMIASSNLQGIALKIERSGESLDTHSASVDENYIPVMGLELIAGENFPKNNPARQEQFLILNEKALTRFQFGSAEAAVGQTLWMQDSIPLVIRGVVRDFHYRILEHGIEPFALRYAPMEYGLLHVRLAAGDPVAAMASLESVWKKLDIVHPFEAEFMDDSIQNAYSHVTFVGGLVSFFALLSLSLACMGLLGSVTQSVASKVKEIGIRKVVGATTAQVTLLLSRRFFVLLAIAVTIALPVGYWISNLFLTLFVYRINVGGLILGGSALVLLALGLLTVGVQAGRAALANPVKSLRSE